MQTEIEDAFDITLHYGDRRGGAAGVLRGEFGWLAMPLRGFCCMGHGGSFKKYGLDPQEPALVGGAKVPRMGSGDNWLEEPKAAWGTLTVAPNPADPGMLVKSEVKTLPGDYRGFYANVRDAINWNGGAGGDG